MREKEECPLSQTGTLSVRVFTSRAQIPLPGATVAISRRTGPQRHTLLAVRVTDENGEVGPLTIAAPDLSGSESPGTKTPFASLDIRVEHPGYELEIIEDVQVFSGVDSLLPVALLPLAEQAIPSEESNTIYIPPQTL